MTLNAENERIKYRYFEYLKEAKQLDVKTVDAVAKALDRFEDSTERKSFKTFSPEQATTFKRTLERAVNERTGTKLAKGTLYPILAALKAFFFWLAGQPGYKSRLLYEWAAYFNMPLKDVAVAKARRGARSPTLDQIRSVVSVMPSNTALEKRNRALIAFTIVTGARDNAIASMKLKHVDTSGRSIFQDGREVRTKFSKSFPTWFFPVGDDLESIVLDWVAFLTSACGLGPEDALFPQTKTGFSSPGVPAPPTLGTACWADTQPIRDIFRRAFTDAGLAYFNPHSFRTTLMLLGMEWCAGNPMALKAWSQNLGHENVLTSFNSYGEVPAHQQRDLVRSAGPTDHDDKIALALGRDALLAARKARG